MRKTQGIGCAFVAGVVGLVGVMGLVFASEDEDPRFPDGSSPEYRREEFATAWGTVDGCSVRHRVLERDLRDPQIASDGCTVLSGTLHDPYTGEIVHYSIDEPSEIHIDHRVPLALAWDGGADSWTPEQRYAFYHDESNLVAVSDDVNLAKSDYGPSEWLPEVHVCRYLESFEETVVEYDLKLNNENLEALKRC